MLSPLRLVRARRVLGLGLAAAALFTIMPPLSGQQPPPPPRAAFVPNEILVRFRNSTSRVQRDAAVGTVAGTVLRRFDSVAIHHTRLRPGMSIDTAIAILATDPDVVAVQPNYLRYADAPSPPNDPYWLNDSLWGLLKIQASAVWNTFTRGSTAAVVADIDTGVNYNHPDLAANMWRNPAEIPGNGVDDDGNGYVDDVYGIDVSSRDSDPMDDNGHGTHTAGTVGAIGNNGIGVVGVNWNARILACKFLSASGSGTDAGAIECFNYIVALKNRGVNIRVSTNSWGGRRDLSGPFPSALKAAVDSAGAAGILNVFAAGNESVNTDVTPFDPASFTSPSIISVAASDGADARASFSNYGATSVDLAAPGVGIVSTYGSGYASLNGTSMATPHVAGAAALLLSQQPSLSTAALKSLLLGNVDSIPGWSSLVASGGRLNVYKAALASTPNISPSAALTSPQDGATFPAPGTVPVTADASDPDGTVVRVDFLVNGAVAVSDTSAPFAATLTNMAAGTYTLTAVAVDNVGATTTSAPRTFTVFVPSNPGPAVSFVRTDTTTLGTWKTAYGGDGYSIVGDATSLPSYAQVALSGQQSWTWATSTVDLRGLQRVSGADRIAATWYGSTFAIDVNVSGTQARQVALYALDFEGAGRRQRFDVLDASTGAVLDSRTLSGFSGGQYVVWTVQGQVRIQVTSLAGPNAVVDGVFFGPAGAVGNPAGAATFVRTDTTTQGSWKLAYGGDGYSIVGDGTNLPSYAQVAASGQQSWTWAASTVDLRALQQVTGGSRIAATWYQSTFAIDVNVTGTQARQVALYALDYEGAGRQQRFDVLDGSTGAVLDSRILSGFSGGHYVVWTVQGQVRIQVTSLAGPNAVVGGVFFGPAGAAGNPTGAATFVRTDQTTQGTWKAAYGGDGYSIVGDATSLPAYAQIALSGQQSWTWAASTGDVRGLQQVSGGGRIAATWYQSTFAIDLNVAGTQARQVALYALDYEGAGRQQRFDVLDGGTGAVLDSRILSGFSGGQYVVWTVRGQVRIQVTSLAGPNAVVGGVFFQ